MNMFTALDEIDRLRARVSELEAAARTPEDDAVLQAADAWYEADQAWLDDGGERSGRMGRIDFEVVCAVAARRKALGASQSAGETKDKQ